MPELFHSGIALGRLINQQHRIRHQLQHGRLARACRGNRLLPARKGRRRWDDVIAQRFAQIHKKLVRLGVFQQWGHRAGLHSGNGTLGIRMEKADAFDFVTEELNADWIPGSGRKNIENAPAHGVLTGHSDGLIAKVAYGVQVGHHVIEQQFLTLPQVE